MYKVFLCLLAICLVTGCRSDPAVLAERKVEATRLPNMQVEIVVKDGYGNIVKPAGEALEKYLDEQHLEVDHFMISHRGTLIGLIARPKQPTSSQKEK